MLRVLAVGDVCGSAGVEYLKKNLRLTAEANEVDLIVVNGDNAADIHGISVADVSRLFKAGADVITTGNHAFGRRDVYPLYEDEPRLLRPDNFPPSAPGCGSVIVSAGGVRVLCMNLQGNVSMNEALASPFSSVDAILGREAGRYDVALLDFHAEATSEKMAMGRFLDGRVQVVFGTHTHVATADEAILPGGTGYITDIGMTGPVGGVIGTDTRAVLYRMTTRMPTRFSVAEGAVEGHGALFTLADTAPYSCLRVERVVF